MDIATVAFLSAAGIAGGTLSSLAGGAGLITFPSLLAVGLSPVVASASNLAALMPGSFLAAFTDRTQLPPLDRAFAGLVVASVTGAALGAALLTVTSTRIFELLVPLLLGFATILFAFGDRISAAIRARSLALHGCEPQIKVTSVPMVLPVSVYGGYFGAGVGVLMLAVMSLATAGEYRPANAAKNLVTAFNSLVAAFVFSAQGVISWPATIAMMGGALIGSQIGTRIARYAPREVIRWVVITVGVLLTATYTWRYWF